MTYFEGFVAAAPSAAKDKFIAHASQADAVFMENGALRIRECWQDNVPKGQTTDFYGAVDATPDESVVFSWIEWPSKTERQAAVERMEDLMADDRMNPATNPMPFDGKRMIYGGFEPIVDQGASQAGSYVQGFIVPVPADKRDAYRELAESAANVFRDYGALRVVEAWQDDVPEGKQTDFFRSVKAEPDENVVFSFVEWPSRAVCDAAAETMQNDERMQPPAGFTMPFDGKRMVWGGFSPVIELGR